MLRVRRAALRLPVFALAGMLANYLALRFFSITQETVGPLTIARRKPQGFSPGGEAGFWWL
jgi:hypothetical protein